MKTIFLTLSYLLQYHKRKFRERHSSLLRLEDFFFNINKPILYFFSAMNFSMQKFSCDTHSEKKNPLISPELPVLLLFFIFSEWRSAFILYVPHRGAQQHDKQFSSEKIPQLVQLMTSSELAGSFRGFITQTHLYPDSLQKIKLSKNIFKCLLPHDKPPH